MSKTIGSKLAGLAVLALFMLSALPVALADLSVDLDSDLDVTVDAVSVEAGNSEEKSEEPVRDPTRTRKPLLDARVKADARLKTRADVRERVKLRFDEARERFDDAKQRYREQRDASREAQEEYRECREASENSPEDCEELKEEFLGIAKGRLDNAVSVLENLLTKLESKISEADHLDVSLQESMLVDVEVALGELDGVTTMIEGLSEEPSREELQEVLVELKVVWEDSHEMLRKFSSILAHSRFETGVVGQLESLLERILVHVEGEEAEALVAEFEAHVAAAADFNSQAQAAVAAEDLDLAKELEAQAREELKDAKGVLRELLSVLREQGVSAADLRSRGAGLEARADASAAVAAE